MESAKLNNLEGHSYLCGLEILGVMAENIKDLFTKQAKPGTISWIGRRPQKKGALESVDQAELSTEEGLEGDHYHGQSGNRQLTLIQEEHLEGVGKMLDAEVHPGTVRRNVVVHGINLLSFKDQTFQIGSEAVLEMTGLCHPCSRMEENLGLGGYNAMRGHGGITARVLKGGTIKVGDQVNLVVKSEEKVEK